MAALVAQRALPTDKLAASGYYEALDSYVHNLDEGSLYAASLLSEACIHSGFGPEDIVALHFESLQGVLKGFAYREQTRAMGDAHQFLLEVMIAYGVRYKEFLELKLSLGLRDAEDRVSRERDRATEAERVTAEKADLLAVIAHELCTPMTAAKGFAELAQRKLSAGKLDEASGMLRSAREAMDRLWRLTADLTEAVRSGPPTLVLSRIDLGPVIDQACAWARPSAVSKGLRLLSAPMQDGVFVMANADALLTMFGNLLANAVRYTPAGGEIRVSYLVDETWLTIEFRDTGIGIAEDQLEAVFGKFYRTPAARQVEPRGLGLGLSLVDQLVRAHGGHVDLKSHLGSGTIFRLVLPVDATQQQEIETGP